MPVRTEFLNQQMNSITGSFFIKVFRKNNDLKRNIISIREKRNAVKEIFFYNNTALMDSSYIPMEILTLLKFGKCDKKKNFKN